MSKQVKQVIALVVIVALGAGYYFFFYNSAPAAPAAPAQQTIGLFPNGTELDMKPLKDNRFINLNPPTYPTVTKDQLNNPNPFVSGATAAPAAPGTPGAAANNSASIQNQSSTSPASAKH